MLNSNLMTYLNLLFAASLGASFYVLMKTQPYLVNRSYDPKYNAVYLSRFFIGVIAGVILAVILGPSLKKALDQVPGAELTPAILALMGGFAAEAVELILQRVVEVMLSAVRGDGSAQVQAKQAEKNADLEKMLVAILAAGDDKEKREAAVQQARAVLRQN